MKNKLLLAGFVLLFLAQLVLYFALKHDAAWLKDFLPFLQNRTTFEIIKWVNMYTIVPVMLLAAFLADSVRTGMSLSVVLAAALVQCFGLRQKDPRKFREAKWNMYICGVLVVGSSLILPVVLYNGFRDSRLYAPEASREVTAHISRIDGKWIYYRFTVLETEQEMEARFVDKRFHSKTGDAIRIVYHINDPQKSITAKSVRLRQLRDWTGIAAGVFLFFLWLFSVVFGLVCLTKGRRYAALLQQSLQKETEEE